MQDKFYYLRGKKLCKKISNKDLMSIYKSIADSVHKYIDIPKKIYSDLIDTIEFQRLRRIMQLAGVQISYPSATHSRFAHSLGAFHIANRIISTLRRRYPQDITKEDVELVLTSALLHDIGHGPFSHMFEDTIKMLCENKDSRICQKFELFMKHEQVSEEIVLSPDSAVGTILKKEGKNKEKIADLIRGRGIEQKPFLNQIVSSQIDADSLDYLMRDSLETGVSFGLYNLDRLFAMMKLSEDKSIVIKEKALQSAEQVVIARYMQFTRVYFHKTVRCWEFMLKLLLSELFKEVMEGTVLPIFPPIEDFVQSPKWQNLVPLTDDSVYAQIQLLSKSKYNDHFLVKLAQKILRRDLFKSCVLTDSMAREIEKREDEITKILEKHGYPPYAYRIDRFVSRYYTPYDEVNRDAILIEKKTGEIVQLSEISEVVASLSAPKYNNLLIFPSECREEIKKLLKTVPKA